MIYANMIGDVDNTQTCSSPANSDKIHSDITKKYLGIYSFRLLHQSSHEDRVAYY